MTFGTYKLCNYANRAFSNSDAYKSFFEENTDRFDDNENVIIDSGSRWNIAENNDVFYSMKNGRLLILI